MEMLNQKQKIIVIVGIVAIAIVIIFYYINSTKSVYDYSELKLENEIEEEIRTKEDKEEQITIHITGAVKKQGVVKAKEDARINDIIELADGLTEDADISKVNLAYIVQDGQKIYIPYKTDSEDIMEDIEVISENAGENVLEEEKTNIGLVNINTASQEMLTSLPGIRYFYSFKNY